MSKLKQILLNYTDSDAAPLGGSGARRLTKEERDRLHADLVRVQHANERFVWLVAGMLFVLFVVLLIIITTNLDKPDIIKSISAAFGISAAGIIRWLVGIWREKTNTETLLQLAVDLEGDALKTVITILARGKKSMV